MWVILPFLFGVLVGVVLVLCGVYYVLSFFLVDPKQEKDQLRFQQAPSTFQLPPALIDKISDESCKSKESCWALNFILYFLFREQRNSEGVRRWVLRKLALEFEELLATTVLGKFFSSISIQNVDLGQNFPVLSWIKTARIEQNPVFNNISTLDILVDLEYSGGFQFAIQAETHLKHSAFLSVQFKGVKGQAQLQFSTEPYAHWSFSFAESPDIDISVVSQLYGKSFSHITSIIASQLKRSVRKKHTLPMYKIRYKPFFARIEPMLAALVPNSAPRADTSGTLRISLLECRGLMTSLLQGGVYAVIGLSDIDWVAAYSDKDDSNSVFLVRDLVHLKTSKREEKLDFVLGTGSENQLVIEAFSSTGKTPAEFEVGDEVLSVDGKKVSNAKQAVKNFKYSGSMKVVWRVRRRYPGAVVREPESKEKDPAASLPTPTEESTEKEERKSRTPSPNRKASVVSTTSNLLEEKAASSGACRLSVPDARQLRIVRTAEVLTSSDPIFTDESFSLKVEEGHRFLNLALWSSEGQGSGEGTTSSVGSSSPTSSPSKKSKAFQAAVESITFGSERLVGTISIPVADILAECGTTGLGHFVKDYYLRSPDGNATEAKEHPLISHSGFEPQMCYGKATLSFLLKPDEEATSSRRRESADSFVEIGTDPLSDPSPTEDYPAAHSFVRTNFRTATVCDYCNKKIWLKEAFACKVCGMRCHKKCNDRCIANTVCRGEGFYAKLLPEIITSGEGDEGCSVEPEEPAQPQTAPGNNGVRRRTLGGFIASAVQNRSAQLSLRRAGSATNLLSPNQGGNSASKSLPPSPKASPTMQRRKSSQLGEAEMNPFEVLKAGGFGSSEEDIHAAVEHIIEHPNDDLVAMAKETGRDVYSELSLPQRKQKLNAVLNRLQEEIDVMSMKRMELNNKAGSAQQIEKYEERVQALALLMLYYCSGLQQVQDLEELEKQDQEDVLSLQVTEDKEEEDEEDGFC